MTEPELWEQLLTNRWHTPAPQVARNNNLLSTTNNDRTTRYNYSSLPPYVTGANFYQPKLSGTASAIVRTPNVLPVPLLASQPDMPTASQQEKDGVQQALTSLNEQYNTWDDVYRNRYKFGSQSDFWGA